jgi:poly(3-hydroxybutyrate) depolymerase
LPKGTMMHRDEKIDLKAIEKTALLTIEGERDDISGVGQTKAAQGLCKNIPASRKKHYEQQGVGHYGIFNGRRWRENIMPVIRDFVAEIK